MDFIIRVKACIRIEIRRDDPVLISIFKEGWRTSIVTECPREDGFVEDVQTNRQPLLDLFRFLAATGCSFGLAITGLHA